MDQSLLSIPSSSSSSASAVGTHLRRVTIFNLNTGSGLGLGFNRPLPAILTAAAAEIEYLFRHAFVSQLDCFPTLTTTTTTAFLIGTTTAAALLFYNNYQNQIDENEIGEWRLFTSPTPFNRFLNQRCPSLNSFNYLHSGPIRRGALSNTTIEYQRICVPTPDGGVISLDWPLFRDGRFTHQHDTTFHRSALQAESLKDFKEAISMVSYGFNTLEEFHLSSSMRDVVANVKIPLLFIQWLTAIELGLLKHRHPLLEDTDVTINPSKSLKLTPSKASDANLASDIQNNIVEDKGINGAVTQTNVVQKVMMNMLDVTMPETLSELQKLKSGLQWLIETLMTALQGAVPEDVRGKLTSSITEILKNQKKNSNGVPSVSNVTGVTSVLNPKIRETSEPNASELNKRDTSSAEDSMKPTTKK
ncbi:hypothetical protein Tco_0579554 [Tanacetum coccineum]